MDREKELLHKLNSKKTKDKAFNELVSLYKERLYWHIRNIVKTHDDTDDVLQNTFIKVYKNIHKFKGESKLFSWMYRIATNEAMTQLNKNAKHLQLSNEAYIESKVNHLKADCYFDGDEIQLKLQKAIAKLPQKQQLVFNMKYFENLKYSQMSEILETSEGALKASYHLAVKKVEDFLTSH